MSPRAASRLESIGFEDVYDYVAGKADWGSAGLPLEGENGNKTRAGAHIRTDVPTCRPGDRLQAVCEQLDASGWDPASSSTSGGSSSAGSDGERSAAEKTSPPRRR